MRRRDFIKVVAGSALTWPLSARAQQPSIPEIAFLSGRSADTSVRVATAFRKGLNETGYMEGQNVTVEYHWLEGRYERLPALMADLVRRQVAVIAIPGSAPAALAAKAATATIPIIFGVPEDPVRLGLVANLARPGGNATGINFFVNEVVAKRLRLLHDMVPRAVRVAVLLNPSLFPAPRPRCTSRRKLPTQLDCKSRLSTPQRSAPLMRPLPALRASAPMPCSSLRTAFSLAVPCNLPP
jgi:putative tryptophan/tyrosine transport system substrate-binding protein